MTSNRTVTYVDIGLNSVGEYWNALVMTGVKAFISGPTPSSVFHAAHSVWHLHDWVWHDRNPGQNSGGQRFTDYRNDLLTACPELGWLRDIADAGKHRGMGRLPEVKGAEPRMTGQPMPRSIVISRHSMTSGGFVGDQKLGYFLVLNDGTIHNVEEVLKLATEYWRSYPAAPDLPSPF